MCTWGGHFIGAFIWQVGKAPKMLTVVYCLQEATSALHAIIQTTNFSETIDWTVQSSSQKYYNFQLYTIKEDIQKQDITFQQVKGQYLTSPPH